MDSLIYYERQVEAKSTSPTTKQLEQMDELLKKKGVVFKEPFLSKKFGRKIEWLYQLTYEEAERLLNED